MNYQVREDGLTRYEKLNGNHCLEFEDFFQASDKWRGLPFCNSFVESHLLHSLEGPDRCGSYFDAGPVTGNEIPQSVDTLIQTT